MYANEVWFAFGALLCMLLMMLCMVLLQVFLGLFVYHDAKSKYNPNAVVYGVLCGLFGLIPLIIYLVIRSQNTGAVECPQCRTQVFRYQPQCPVCGFPIATLQYRPAPQTERYRSRSRIFLILTIVSLALMVLFFIGIFALMIGGTAELSATDRYLYYS